MLSQEHIPCSCLRYHCALPLPQLQKNSIQIFPIPIVPVSPSLHLSSATSNIPEFLLLILKLALNTLPSLQRIQTTTYLTHISSHFAQLQPIHSSALQKSGLAQQHLHEQAHESRAASQAHSVAIASDQHHQLQSTSVHIQTP